jgi:hypothetical protein
MKFLTKMLRESQTMNSLKANTWQRKLFFASDGGSCPSSLYTGVLNTHTHTA